MLLTLSSCSDGLKGSGKTMSLCHTVHFCYTQGWLVLHIPDGETNTVTRQVATYQLPLQKRRKCKHWPSYILPVFLYFIIQLTSGWRTVRSCCLHPITPLALISRCKPQNGYATSESPMSTSFQRYFFYAVHAFMNITHYIILIFAAVKLTEWLLAFKGKWRLEEY